MSDPFDSNDPRDKMLEMVQKETQIHVSFNTKHYGEGIAADAVEGGVDMTVASVEMPEAMLDFICKAATIGCMAAKAMGVPVQINGYDEDGNPRPEVDVSDIENVMHAMWPNEVVAGMELSLALLGCGVISKEGYQYEGEQALSRLASELDAIPTYERPES